MSKNELEQFGNIINKVFDNPDMYPDRVTFLSLTKEEERQLLTPKRIELLRTIRENKQHSISELAKTLRRDIASVSRDLKVLENHGIVDLEREGHRKKPTVVVDRIIIPLRSRKS